MKRVFTNLTKKIALGLTVLMIPFMVHAQWVFEVTSPAEIAGLYPIAMASFGNNDGSENVSGNLVLGMDNTSNPTLGCEALETDLTGSIGLLDRGECPFIEKAINAQNAGAIAILICNNENNVFTMTGGGQEDEVDIRSGMLRNSDCTIIKTALNSGDVTGEIYLLERPSVWSNGFDDPDDWIIDGPDGFGPTNGFSITDSEGPNITWWANTRINSETGGNYALFQNGNPQTPGSVLEAAPFTLTYSQPIDLSESDFPALRFNQSGARFIEYQAVQISVDGGQSWIDIGNNDDIPPLTAIGGSAFPNPMPRLYNIYPFLEEGVDEIHLRLFWDGRQNGPSINYIAYGWFIDDLQIIEVPETNIRVNDSYNPLPSFATPINHAQGFLFEFGLTIGNLGLDQDLVSAFVEIRNSETNEVVFESTEEVSNIPGATDTFYIFDFAQNLDLDVGTYVLTYRIDAPGKIDFDYSDNSESYFFKITEDIFAKEDPAVDSFNNRALLTDENATWFYGVPYYIAPQEDEKDVMFLGIETALAVEGGEFTDEVAILFLMEFVPDGSAWVPTIFDGSNIQPDANPNLDIVSIAIIDTEKLTNAGSGKKFEISVSEFLDPVELNPIEEITLNQDKVYFLVLQIDQGIIPTLGVAINNVMNYSINNQFVYARNQFFGSFSGFDNAPVLRMRVDGPVNTIDGFESHLESLMVFPIPASNELYINLDLDQPTDIEIQFFDINGRLINSSFHNNITTESIESDVTAYQAGTYIIRVVTKDGKVQSRQVLIVK
jgi:hypothetical protein